MQPRAKYFPYPILVAGNQDYQKSTFKVKLTPLQQLNDLEVAMQCQLDNYEILQLIDNGLVSYACHVECTQTCYRRLFTTQHAEESFIIPYDQLNGTVEISSFLVAAQNIPNFSNEDFTEDLRGFTFSIDRGCCLGVGQSIRLVVDQHDNGFQNNPSIFTIIKSLNVKQKNQLRVEYQGEKIQIILSEEMFDLYHSLSHMPEHTQLLHSLFLVPALMKVFYELKGQCDDFSEKHWYLSLDATYHQIGKSFAEAVENDDPYLEAQKLLNHPIGQSLIKLAEGVPQEEGDTDED